MNETMFQEFEAYAVACDVCASLLVQAPTEESLDRLASLKNLLDEEPFTSINTDASKQVVQVLGEYQQNGKEVLSELRQDYTFLFDMISVSKTSPFESVYVTDDRTMCGPSLLEVRALYHQWGVMLPKEVASLEDHIGYELSFVSHLLHVAMDHVEKDESCDKEIEVLGLFVKEHINVFAEDYFTTAEKAARSVFYRNVMALTHSLVKRLTERFV